MYGLKMKICYGLRFKMKEVKKKNFVVNFVKK